MSNSPAITVLVPVYNAREFIARAIQSILHQTFTDFELLLIDDASTDDSVEVMRSVAGTDPRARLVLRPHEGYTKVLNFGLAVARGEFVARMDADDIARPNRLAEQVAYLKSHTRCAVVGGHVRCFTRENEPGEVTYYPLTDAEIRRLLPTRSCFAHPATMIRKSALPAGEPYRPPLEPAEDYDLWLRLSERHDLANIDRVVLDYRIHDKQVSFTRLERQIVLTAAIAELGRRRVAGLAEPPLDPAADDARAFAASLGLNMTAINRVLLAQMIGRYEFLHARGNTAQAGELAGLVMTRFGELGSPGLARSALAWSDADRALRRGRRHEGLRLLARSVLAHPSALRRLCGAVARRITGEPNSPK